ncbi:MAG: T9SS type A sorting domain-containing protein [Saprospiraceae bacterium]
MGKYQPVGGSPGERFGHVLAASGDRVALGAPLSDVSGRVDQGRAYVLDGEDCGGLPRPSGVALSAAAAAAPSPVRCWPSPFSDALTIEIVQPRTSNPASEIQVTDAAGRVVLRAGLPAGQPRLELNTGALRPGLYFVQVGTGAATQTVPVALVR